MTLPIAISDVLHGHGVEWERLEFKKSWNPVDVLHTLCAFANDFHNLGGGYVILGIEESDGRPVLPPAGLSPQEVDHIQKELLNLGNSAIRPSYHPLAAPYEIDGRLVLVLWAPGGRTRPYRRPSSGSTRITATSLRFCPCIPRRSRQPPTCRVTWPVRQAKSQAKLQAKSRSWLSASMVN